MSLQLPSPSSSSSPYSTYALSSYFPFLIGSEVRTPLSLAFDASHSLLHVGGASGPSTSKDHQVRSRQAAAQHARGNPRAAQTQQKSQPQSVAHLAAFRLPGMEVYSAVAGHGPCPDRFLKDKDAKADDPMKYYAVKGVTEILPFGGSDFGGRGGTVSCSLGGPRMHLTGGALVGSADQELAG